MGIAKSNEKLAENFENSSKTASFHSFLNGWQQKMPGFTCFSVFFQKFDSEKNSVKNQNFDLYNLTRLETLKNSH